jgi:hypothetical protein
VRDPDPVAKALDLSIVFAIGGGCVILRVKGVR